MTSRSVTGAFLDQSPSDMASTVQSTSLIPESLIQNTRILASSTAQPISPDRSRKVRPNHIYVPLPTTHGAYALQRKLEEVITSVDHALAPPEEPEVISRPSKRFHTSRSLYSTLAKYGIGGKNTKAPASYVFVFSWKLPQHELSMLIVHLRRRARRYRKHHICLPYSPGPPLALGRPCRSSSPNQHRLLPTLHLQKTSRRARCPRSFPGLRRSSFRHMRTSRTRLTR